MGASGGGAARKRQELEKAQAQCDILVREPPPDADHLISAALVDIELSQPVSALVHLDRALSGRQRINDAYFFRGLALVQVQDTAQALDAFASVAPSTNYTRALREAADEQQGRVDQATCRDAQAARPGGAQ